MARRRGGGAPNHSAFSRYFASLPDVVNEKTLKVIKEGSELVVAEAKSLCPTGPDTKSANYPGALRDSIKYDLKTTRKGTRSIITAGAKNPKTGVPYGQYVEFDPKNNGEYKFMYPAMDKYSQQIHNDILAAIREGVRANVKS